MTDEQVRCEAEMQEAQGFMESIYDQLFSNIEQGSLDSLVAKLERTLRCSSLTLHPLAHQ